MPRYRLILEYDGSAFIGWQLQATGLSVQGAVEAALAKLTGEASRVHGAGRTDAGVHALSQTAHVDLAHAWEPHVLRNALNFHLRPHPVSVLAAERVDAQFHARFGALKRQYLYRIVCRPAPLTIDKGRAWWLPFDLDADAMNDAAQELLGRHDFTTFRSAACQAQSPVKTLDRLDVKRAGDRIEIETQARSFLHHQVRSMVGSLKLVGEGKWTAAGFRAALDARNRAACGPVAPAEGLYLMGVDYPSDEPK